MYLQNIATVLMQSKLVKLKIEWSLIIVDYNDTTTEFLEKSWHLRSEKPCNEEPWKKNASKWWTVNSELPVDDDVMSFSCNSCCVSINCASSAQQGSQFSFEVLK